MENLYVNLFGFIFCSGMIVFSGTKLSIYGDQIAELTGMGRAWVGLILMASVTSLPELITGISSVAFVKAPDLAAGDIFGSCVFNLLILSVLDARIKKPLFSTVKSSHIVAAIFSILLFSVAGISLYLAQEIPSVFWISSFSLVLFLTYLLAIWGIFNYDKSQQEVLAIKAQNSSHAADLKRVIKGYAFHTLLVIASAIFLPYFGANIASQTGIGNSFFGTLFLAATTSLPELVISLAALKLGALDMAVGNLLGSNVFNMFILGLDDVFYREGSLFNAISPSHLLSIFITILMTAVVGLGLLFRPNRKHVWLLSIDTFVIVCLYLALMVYLFVRP